MPGHDADIVTMLVHDNAELRKAGLALSEAATRTIKTYDGLHRLSLAVSAFMQVVANEGGRPHVTQVPRWKQVWGKRGIVVIGILALLAFVWALVA